MLIEKVGAEHFAKEKILLKGPPTGRSPVLYVKFDAFDEKTGKRNLLTRFRCPKYNCLWGAGHDSYRTGKPKITII